MVNSLVVKRVNYYLLSLDRSSKVLAVVSRPTRHGSGRTKAAGAEFKSVYRRCLLPLGILLTPSYVWGLADLMGAMVSKCL